MSNTILLPFQPDAMTPAQLAAVSYLARYSGHTHSLYAYQLRRWFAWCETNRLAPLVGIQRAHVELYIRHLGLDRLELIRFLQIAQTITVHHGALAYLLGINALRASEAAAVRIEDYRETLRGHRVLHLVGKGTKPATMPLTVPVLRVLEACRGERTDRPWSYVRSPASRSTDATATAWSPGSRGGRYPATRQPALSASRRDHQRSRRRSPAQRCSDPGATRRPPHHRALRPARGNLDRHGVHFLTAYVAGV